MKWLRFGIIVIVILVLILMSHLPLFSPPLRHIELGFWTQGLYDAQTNLIHPEALLSLQKTINKKVAIAHYYVGWEDLPKPDFLQNIQLLQKNNWTPMISSNPYFFANSDVIGAKCPTTAQTLYAAIASGACDTFLHAAGKNLSTINKPFYFVFAWEMNNKSNQWSIPYTRSNPADFIAAWRHIHDIFMQEKVKNILWVFDPNVPEDNVSYKSMYPGDRYVDYFGLDGYNWGVTQSWSSWESFGDIFTKSYNQLLSINPHKKIILVEVNTTDEGGDKGAWYTDMLTHQIPSVFPQISAVVFYNEDRSVQEGINWKVDVNEESLKSFVSAIHTPFY